MATNATAAAVTAPPMVIARMTMKAFSDESDPRSSATWSPRSHAASVTSDRVSVAYHQQGDALHASNVRVTMKAAVR